VASNGHSHNAIKLKPKGFEKNNTPKSVSFFSTVLKAYYFIQKA
jgi:hypothetical protein